MKFFSKSILLLTIFANLLTAAFMTTQVLAQSTGSNVQLVNPIGGSVKDGGNKQGIINVQDLVGKGLTVVLGVMGSLTLAAFVFGGYMWLTSAGNDEKVRKGTDTLMYSTIGLFIIFGAYAILNTILKGLAK